MSLCRQNFHDECESALNGQINLHLTASYTFNSLAWYYDRDSVALQGFHKFFLELSDAERNDADKLMSYQNKRGGRLVLTDIVKPSKDDWSSPLEAMQFALETKKSLNQSLLALEKVAGGHGDPQMDDFVEDEFLVKQVEMLKKLADFITQLKRCGSGLGEYVFDREAFESS